MAALLGIMSILSLTLVTGLDSGVEPPVPRSRVCAERPAADAGTPARPGSGQEPAPKGVPEPPQEPDAPVHVATEGRVKLRDGKPAARAHVTIEGPDGFNSETYADESGQFQLEGPEGAYSLVIQAGDRQERFSAQIADRRLVPAEFTLR